MTDSNTESGQIPAEEAAIIIRELLDAGQTEEQIRADRPDLEAGWDKLADADKPAENPSDNGSYSHTHSSETFQV